MEVRIKQGEEMIDATIEMVDGVMVVSPKERHSTHRKVGDVVYVPKFVLEYNFGFYFKPTLHEITSLEDVFLRKKMCFNESKDCEVFCNKLNEAINQVKP